MAVSRDLLDEIYQGIYERAEEAFPEFGFKHRATGYVSTTEEKVDGTAGKRGKVYLYRNNPGRLIDYTRSPVSLWDYIAERESITDNGRVLMRLAELGRIKLPELSPELAQRAEEARKARELWEAANDFLIDCLSGRDNDHAQTSGAQALRNYLQHERGYRGTDFRLPGAPVDPERPGMELGFMPSQEALYSYLEAKGYGREYIREELKLSGGMGTTHQLTVPYRDTSGRIRGLMARTITSGKEHKYRYTVGLKKGEILFNLRPLKGDRDLVIVESPLDALLATARGIDNVAAIGGKDISGEQVELIIKARPSKITLCLDNDPAGEDGTQKALELLSDRVEVNLYLAELPDGFKDPGELMAKRGAEAFTETIKHAITVSDYHINRINRKYEGRELTPKETDELFNEITETAAVLKTRADEDYFIDRFCKSLSSLGFSREAYQERTDRIREARAEEQQKREALRISQELRGAIERDGAEQALRDYREKAAALLVKRTGGIEAVSFADILRDISNTSPALKTGYDTLDTFAGIPSGAITLIAGRPGHGKTTFMLNLLLNLTELYPERSFYFFTFEEPRANITLKLINNITNADLVSRYGSSFRNLPRGNNYELIKAYIKSGRHDIAELERAQDQLRELVDGGRIRIIDQTHTAERLGELLSVRSRRENIGAAFIDYVQRIPAERRTQDMRTQVAHVSDTILKTAKDTGLPIVLGAQFNREAEGAPTLAKLKEAGNLEEDANTVLSVYNRSKDDQDKGVDGYTREVKLEITALKNREGEANRPTELTFNTWTGRIYESKPF